MSSNIVFAVVLIVGATIVNGGLIPSAVGVVPSFAAPYAVAPYASTYNSQYNVHSIAAAPLAPYIAGPVAAAPYIAAAPAPAVPFAPAAFIAGK